MKNPESTSLIVFAEILLRDKNPAAVVKIVNAVGSTPRDTGTFMLVTADAIYGTVGGGQLEWLATSHARQFLATSDNSKKIDIALGPEIGQCCGGRVTLEIFPLNDDAIAKLGKAEGPENNWRVQIHGAGHTGHALCASLALLPLKVEIIDVREDALFNLPDSVDRIHDALPEKWVRKAQPGTAFVIFTHDHQLDFLIAAEALKRGDAAYVGMIGSKTKRAVFKSWLGENGYDPHLETFLTSPIGGAIVKDKRPEVISALVSSELINVFSQEK